MSRSFISARGSHLIGGEQPLSPLVQLAAQRLPAHCDAVAINHVRRIDLFAPDRNPPSRSVARQQITIHLPLRMPLARFWLDPGDVELLEQLGVDLPHDDGVQTYFVAFGDGLEVD
jgi:hypothetical protein